MGRTTSQPCPRCRSRGRDRRGDNLCVYADGSAHCFSCGYHKHAAGYLPKVRKEQHDPQAPLPRDFTREVPATGWKWLLQYGLPYTYWKPFTGYSPAEERLVITHGDPIETSVGRWIGRVEDLQLRERVREGVPMQEDHVLLRTGDAGGVPVRRHSKWKQWGDKSRSATILEPKDSHSYEGVVLVEDLISAHKVGQVAKCLPLFGTAIYPKVIATLRPLKRPVSLWLDDDQYTLLAPKINRLQALLNVPVRFIRTEKDPKSYTTEEIKEILK